jgi:hypothetical protein
VKKLARGDENGAIIYFLFPAGKVVKEKLLASSWLVPREPAQRVSA